MQTPTSPVNLACAVAMSAQISSWVGRMYSRPSPARSAFPSAPSNSPIPSPGNPKTRLTPHSRMRSITNSLTVVMVSPLSFGSASPSNARIRAVNGPRDNLGTSGRPKRRPSEVSLPTARGPPRGSARAAAGTCSPERRPAGRAVSDRIEDQPEPAADARQGDRVIDLVDGPSRDAAERDSGTTAAPRIPP